MDYYSILGIAKTASDDEIKKAYKKLALQWHPDRNPNNTSEATEKFKQISEAYSVLSDPQQRQTYDQFGIDGLKGQTTNTSSVFEELFKDFGFSRHFNPFQSQQPNSNSSHQQQKYKRSPDTIYEINVPLAELFTGTVKRLKLNRDVICQKCKGNGTASAQPINTKCSDCRGQGSKIEIRQLGPGFISQQQIQCQKCKGTGEYIDPSQQCQGCKGCKTHQEESIFEVNITAGASSGDTVIFNQKSNEIPGADTGDFRVIIKEIPDPLFKRENYNLVHKVNIPLADALCGTSIEIIHIDKRILKFTYNEIIKPFSRIPIKGEGMGKKGDLILEFNVVFPNTITNKNKTELRSLLF